MYGLNQFNLIHLKIVKIHKFHRFIFWNRQRRTLEISMKTHFTWNSNFNSIQLNSIKFKWNDKYFLKNQATPHNEISYILPLNRPKFNPIQFKFIKSFFLNAATLQIVQFH